MSDRKLLLPKLDLDLIAGGSFGWAYKINDHIAMKSPHEDECVNFAHENRIYDIFESHPPCPDLSQSFLRVPGANFLVLYTGGSLEDRLREYQVRTDGRCLGFLIEVKKKEPINLVERWIMELSNAAAWIESLGYVHGDIRPRNLLLDGQDHLKLADFDCVREIGTKAEGTIPPYARVLGSEAGEDRGTYGLNGARYEQFAIGSILYYMTRGHEPYDDGTTHPNDGTDLVGLMRDKKFPPLGEGKLDTIIHWCWEGKFNTLKDLADETKLLPGAISLPRATAFDEDYCSKVREECKQLIENGILDKKSNYHTICTEQESKNT